MQLGTAKITFLGSLWQVRWMNVGNFLRNDPRYFETANEAWNFCRERGLRVVN